MNRIVQTREAFKLALSMMLVYALSLWMDWEMPKYGALAIVLISLGTTGASLQKGIMRLVGTTVGLCVALLLLACFAQDRWLSLIFMAGYLVIVAYFMQGSRFPYAWFVAGFLVPLVWSTTYMQVDTAFNYASFRYLETTAGVLIYTLVSVLLWPIRASDRLGPQGENLWQSLGQLLQHGREELATGKVTEYPRKTRQDLETGLSSLSQTLQTATTENSSVRSRRKIWEALLRKIEGLVRDLETWQKSLRACQGIDLTPCRTELEAQLDRAQAQLDRVAQVWASMTSSAGHEELPKVPEDLPHTVEAPASERMNSEERGRMAAFWRRTQDVLDSTDQVMELSQLLLEENPSEATRQLRQRFPPPRAIRPQPERLRLALLPAICLVLGFFLWILTDPPAGTGVPNFAATMGLVMVLTPFAIKPLLMTIIGSVIFAVAPVYIFLMPALQDGVSLLAMIFTYTFVFGFLGGFSPALKIVPLALFVMLTGISNDQSYSLMAMINPAIMFLLSFAILAVVHGLMFRTRPEEKMLATLRSYFSACASYLRGLANAGQLIPSAKLSRSRESLHRMPTMLADMQAKLSKAPGAYALGRLTDATHSLSLGLQAMEADRVDPQGTAALEDLQASIEASLASWQKLQPGATIDQRALMAAAENRFAAIQQPSSEVFLGSFGALLSDLSETRAAMAAFDFSEITEARF